MSHSLIKVWIHTVFRTKYSHPAILPPIEEKIYEHIRGHIEMNLECPVIAINGMTDHIHILVRLSQHIAIMDLVKNIKGESSHWINRQLLTGSTFKWQIGYGAFSVSEREVKTVKRYIQNQKIHHRNNLTIENYEKLSIGTD